MPTWRRVAVRLLVATAVATALGLTVPARAPASCVGPQLTVIPQPDVVRGAAAEPTASATTAAATTPATATVAPGQPVVVEGTWFHDGCADVIETTSCSGPRPVDPESPMRGVELHLVQGERTWALGARDAEGPEQQYRVRWRTSLPTDVAAGPARLVAGTAQVTIVIRGRGDVTP